MGPLNLFLNKLYVCGDFLEKFQIQNKNCTFPTALLIKNSDIPKECYLQGELKLRQTCFLRQIPKVDDFTSYIVLNYTFWLQSGNM